MSRPVWRSVLALVAVIAGIGCGIPEDEGPTAIPGGVLSPVFAPGNGAASDRPGIPHGDAPVYLVQAEQLVRVVRRSSPSDLSAVVRLLLDGPTESEFAAGLRSAISPRTTLHSARIDGDTAVVDLSVSFVEVGGQEQILAVAQIVLTAAAVPGVTQVRFLLDGEAVDVPRADGTLTSDTVRAVDYRQLLQTPP